MQPLDLSQILRKKNYHRPLLFNGVLWILAFVIFLFIFSKGHKPILIDYIYTGMYLFFLVIPVSFNFYVLIPRLLRRERYVLYFSMITLSCLGFSAFAEYGLSLVLNISFPDFYFISYPSKFDHLIIYSITIFATTLLKLAEDWFSFNTKQNQLLKLEKNQVLGQLTALRSQINPHFLFNSLNVIYSLALEKNDKITDSILQLSDILRYVIYDSNVERVTIAEEIDVIEKYIEFQRYRHQLKDVISLHITVEDQDYKIYPMLLLPFVENSFKHGMTQNNEDAFFISITIGQSNKNFELEVRNNFEKHTSKKSMESSGIGIENIKNNLQLVYPNKHELEISVQDDLYLVKLKIES